MKVQSDELTDRVCTILVRYGDPRHVDEAVLDPSTPIFGPSGFITDSLAVLDALCDIEADLGVSIPDEDLTEELFVSLTNLMEYLRSRVGAADGD